MTIASGMSVWNEVMMYRCMKAVGWLAGVLCYFGRPSLFIIRRKYIYFGE